MRLAGLVSKKQWHSLLSGPGLGTDGFDLRAWFIAYLLWMMLLALAALAGLELYQRGSLAAGSVWLLALGLFYLSLCCSFFPAPTAWIVMLLASGEVSLIDSVALRVAVVSLACGLATSVANLNEYYLITFLLRYRGMAKIRKSRVYKVLARWFATFPFTVITLMGFLPIPVDMVRWLAVIYRYSRLHYFLAYVLGRTARNAVLAVAVVWLELGWWEIILIQAALVVPALGKMLHGFKKRVER